MGTTIVGIVLLVLHSVIAIVLVVLTILKMGMNQSLLVFDLDSRASLYRVGCSVVPLKTSWF